MTLAVVRLGLVPDGLDVQRDRREVQIVARDEIAIGHTLQEPAQLSNGHADTSSRAHSRHPQSTGCGPSSSPARAAADHVISPFHHSTATSFRVDPLLWRARPQGSLVLSSFELLKRVSV